MIMNLAENFHVTIYVLCFFLSVHSDGLQCAIVAFPIHTELFLGEPNSLYIICINVLLKHKCTAIKWS